MPAVRRKPRRRATTVRAEALEGVRTLVAALSHSARAVERSTGVTNAQLFLLQQLAMTDSLSVNDLAARARTQQSTVSIVVARLVRAGLASKRRSRDDGRVAVVSITAKGRRLVAHAPVPPTSELLRAIEALPASDARALGGGLRALIDALGLSPSPVTMLFEHAPTRRSPSSRQDPNITRSTKRNT